VNGHRNPPLDIPVAFDALDRALRMRILEEEERGYAFRHPIVRAAVYDGLSGTAAMSSVRSWQLPERNSRLISGLTAKELTRTD
jgi:hypothetical protein